MNEPIPMSSPGSPDLILTMIACCMAEGLDVREAIIEVGQERVNQAWLNAPAGCDTAKRLLALVSVKERMDQDDHDMEKALELSDAGWLAIDPRNPNLPPPKTIWEKTPVMSWRWRAPAKRDGKLGRLYTSTNQAFNALQRQKNGQA